jgi:hypothetical protein
MADNFVDVAKQFCDFYYQTFDADRKQLGPLYRDQSMLTYESSSVQGVAAIVEKLSVGQLPAIVWLIKILRGGRRTALAPRKRLCSDDR